MGIRYRRARGNVRLLRRLSREPGSVLEGMNYQHDGEDSVMV
jgi:hypothetical protein